MRKDRAPAWFPAPRYVTYEGIDLGETRATLATYLGSSDTMFQGLLRYWNLTLSVDECLDKFFGGRIAVGYPSSCWRGHRIC